MSGGTLDRVFRKTFERIRGRGSISSKDIEVISSEVYKYRKHGAHVIPDIVKQMQKHSDGSDERIACFYVINEIARKEMKRDNGERQLLAHIRMNMGRVAKLLEKSSDKQKKALIKVFEKWAKREYFEKTDIGNWIVKSGLLPSEVVAGQRENEKKSLKSEDVRNETSADKSAQNAPVGDASSSALRTGWARFSGNTLPSQSSRWNGTLNVPDAHPPAPRGWSMAGLSQPGYGGRGGVTTNGGAGRGWGMPNHNFTGMGAMVGRPPIMRGVHQMGVGHPRGVGLHIGLGGVRGRGRGFIPPVGQMTTPGRGRGRGKDKVLPAWMTRSSAKSPASSG